MLKRHERISAASVLNLSSQQLQNPIVKMVRVQNPSDEGDGTTSTFSTTESTTSAATIAGSKRSRPKSSLDFKANVDHKRKLIVKPDDTEGSTSKSSQQKKSFANTVIMGMNPTRARGSSGYIPPKPRFATLQEVFASGLNDDEMMDLIQNDPVLSAQLAESQRDYQKQQQQESAAFMSQQRTAHGPTTAPRGAGGNRRPSSGPSYKKSTPIKSSKDRVELLKVDGIPYMQWAVLVLVFLFSLYQLYVWMQPPADTKNNRNNKKKYDVNDELVAKELEGAIAKAASAATNNKASGKKMNRSTKKKPSSISTTGVTPNAPQSKATATPPVKAATGATSADTASFMAEANHAMESDESGWMSVKKNTKATTSATSSYSKKDKKSKDDEVAAVVATSSAPEDAITVHTSNITSLKNKKMSNGSNTAHTTIIPLEEVVVPVKQQMNEEKALPSVLITEATPDTKETVVAETEPDIAVVVSNGTSEEGEVDVAGETVTKKKKIKKKKAKGDVETTNVAASTSQSDTVDADAALAQQLQNEENELAAAEAAARLEESKKQPPALNGTSLNAEHQTSPTKTSTDGNDDDWAPVTKKKKAVAPGKSDDGPNNTEVNEATAVAPKEKVETNDVKNDDDDDDDDEEDDVE